MRREPTLPHPDPAYLQPYKHAVSQHGGGFASLLWASPRTQAARFDAILRTGDLRGLKILDAGCGRADLLLHMMQRDMIPRSYIGVEAVAELAAIAQATTDGYPDASIVSRDFVVEPDCLDAGADVTVFCGSLNTLDAFAFEMVLRRAFIAARVGVVFNFLCSPARAAASHLTWHRPQRVLGFARSISRDVRMVDDYLDGDCTMGIFKDIA